MLKATALALPLPPSFHDALRVPRAERAIIAEIGRKSPYAEGSGATDNLLEAVQAAERAGATALAIYTDDIVFGGGYEDVLVAAQTTSLPILCKDFIIDPIQILSARAHGASAVLLIATLLSTRELKALATQAWSLGLGVIVEAHSATELDALTRLRFGPAEPQGIRIIGVSSRDLDTHGRDHGLHARVAPAMPEHAIHVAEGNVESLSDIQRLERSGYDAFFVDTWLREPELFETRVREFAGESIG